MRLCLYHAKSCSEKRCQFPYCSKIKKNQNVRGLKRKNLGKKTSKKIWKGDLSWENDVTEFKFGYKREKFGVSDFVKAAFIAVFRFTSGFQAFRLPDMSETIILVYNQKIRCLAK